MNEITTYYRGWTIFATDTTAIGDKFDGSEEHFECHRQPDIETALGMGKRKIDRLEGVQEWDANYTNGALL